jgi:hypothetical protein
VKTHQNRINDDRQSANFQTLNKMLIDFSLQVVRATLSKDLVMGRYSSMLHNFLEKKSQVAFCQNACSKQILPLKHLPLNQPTAFLNTR